MTIEELKSLMRIPTDASRTQRCLTPLCLKDTDDYYHIESSNMCLTYKIW